MTDTGQDQSQKLTLGKSIIYFKGTHRVRISYPEDHFYLKVQTPMKSSMFACTLLPMCRLKKEPYDTPFEVCSTLCMLGNFVCFFV